MSLHTNKIDKLELIKGAFFGGIVSALMSYVITFYVIGMPAKPMENAVNNAISGGMSAFMNALVVTVIYVKVANSKIACS